MATIAWPGKYSFHHGFPFPTMRFCKRVNYGCDIVRDFVRYSLFNIVLFVLDKQNSIDTKKVAISSPTMLTSYSSGQIEMYRYYGENMWFENFIGLTKTF